MRKTDPIDPMRRFILDNTARRKATKAADPVKAAGGPWLFRRDSPVVFRKGCDLEKGDMAICEKLDNLVGKIVCRDPDEPKNLIIETDTHMQYSLPQNHLGDFLDLVKARLLGGAVSESD